MSFSNEWDKRYQENTHMSVFPWSDLVSLVMKYSPQKEKFKVLELGLFEKFKILSMTHKISSEKIPNNDWTLATWNFVAEKVV